jgi:hypothetical protein
MPPAGMSVAEQPAQVDDLVRRAVREQQLAADL